MEWFNDFTDWLFSASARPTVFTAFVIGFAFLASGLLAAWIARGSVRRLIEQRDNESKATAIAALIDAATEASVWNSLTPQEQVLADRAVGEADIRVRMLPIRGAAVAANWAAHQLNEMKRASATFGYELDPFVVEFRDRLIDWQRRPSRARKLFQTDLERWKVLNSSAEKALLAEQDAWVAEQHHQRYEPAADTVAYVPTAPATDSTDADTQRLLDDVSALPARQSAGQTTA
ncbi:MAG: hypothetical protein ABWY36_08350 [Leifsonia sp.]